MESMIKQKCSTNTTVLSLQEQWSPESGVKVMGENLLSTQILGKKLLCYYRQNDINLYQCVLYEMTVQYFKNAPEKT